MKKLFSLFILCLMGTMSLFAQTNPNRVLITDKAGYTKGYLAERVDSIWFARVEGRIAADVEFLGYVKGDGTTGDIVNVSVKRTPGCEAFRIDCMPKNRADLIGSDDALASYIDNGGSEQYFQDFTNANMSGYTFTPGTDYSIITVGYDMYGIPCGVSRVDFTTPKPEIVGDCSMDYEVIEATKDAITMKLTPGSGVSGYAACLFVAGQAETQFAQMGPMFGFANIGDMVKAFGFNGTSATTYTWTNNNPGTDYEVYIQPWDVNGTYADMVVVPVTTDKLGGEGVAEMSISIGDFGGDAATGYYQIVTYTPNDQTSMHRDIIIEKQGFEQEWNEDKIKEYLQTDIPEDPYWNQYGVDVAYWTADPATEYIAFSIGQNINGEWGPLARLDFSTPAVTRAAVGGKAPATGIMPARKASAGTQANTVSPFVQGKAPATKLNVKKTLIEK